MIVPAIYPTTKALPMLDVRRHRAVILAVFVRILVGATAWSTTEAVAAAPGSTVVSMTPDEWKVAPPIGWVGDAPPTISFARYEGFPKGAMTLNEDVAESTTAKFSNGVIEFDIKPLAYSDTGIIFRRNGNESGEIVYLRANPDCPAADDCIQYAPITHGLMQWDIYADKQGPAQISPTGWNHLRLVVAGERMLVFVNRQTEPALVVPKLQGITADGGIAFKGPAIYANLVITPGEPTGLPDLVPAPNDAGAVINWRIAGPAVVETARPLSAMDIPSAASWRPFLAEPNGLVNFSREFVTEGSGSPSIGWMKAVVTTSQAMRRTMRVGWARQVTVFLNGAWVFSGDNPYYPADRRLSPDGRLEPDNGSISLALQPGSNVIVLAVSNGWRTHAGVEKPGLYGWGAEIHFDDLTGLALSD